MRVEAKFDFKQYEDKIIATCEELGYKFIHKFGTKVVEFFWNDECMGIVESEKEVNPEMFKSVIGDIFPLMHSMRLNYERKIKDHNKIAYEKKAMMLN